MSGFRPNGVRHWTIAKVADPSEWASELRIPRGMHWIAMPPRGHCLSENVMWFPNGHAAIDYFEGWRRDLLAGAA